jgi:hypothetical protein
LLSQVEVEVDIMMVVAVEQVDIDLHPDYL